MKEYWKNISTGRKIGIIAGTLFAILLLIFAIQNRKAVLFSLVFARFEISLTLLIILSAAIGYLIASLFHYRKFKQKDKEITALKQKIEQYLTDRHNSL